LPEGQRRRTLANGEAHTAQAALLEADYELAPARGAFATGKLHAEDTAAALPVDADGHEHGARADDAILAHLFVARIKDEIRILPFEPLPGKLLQLRRCEDRWCQFRTIERHGPLRCSLAVLWQVAAVPRPFEERNENLSKVVLRRVISISRTQPFIHLRCRDIGDGLRPKVSLQPGQVVPQAAAIGMADSGRLFGSGELVSHIL
jgi:hypothetical protein